MFDSRCKHPYEKYDWPQRKNFIVGEYGIEAEPLVPPDRIIIPPLHIKLGLMRIFIVNALTTQPELMADLKEIFDKKTELKLSYGVCFFLLIRFKNIAIFLFHFQGIFDGPEIRKLINNDGKFVFALNEVNFRGWNSFKVLVHDFFGNRRAENYHQSIDELLSSFREMDYAAAAVKNAEKERKRALKNPGKPSKKADPTKESDDLHGMSVKLHYLHLHRDKFPGAGEVNVYLFKNVAWKLIAAIDFCL